MKCEQCGSEWSVSDKLKQTIVKCPFCGAELNKNRSRTITDVLVEWGRKEGLNFFRNSIKINGILADMFLNMGRERNAIKATIFGDTKAAYRIAEIYYGDERTIEESVRWYTSAANQGHSKAQNSLGYMYEHGEGVNKDTKTAFYWFQKAASNGNRNAQHNLAFFYYKGLGTSVDYKKAFEWYTKAASQGHLGAQNNLSVLYEYGYGVEENLSQAIRWYKMAAVNGNEDGQINYDRCIKIVSV